MKKLNSFFTVLTFISFVIFFQSCGEEENPVEPPDGNQVKIPETTKSVDSTDYSSNLVNISNDSLTFTFQSEFSNIYKPAINDILVIENGDGLLRKITEIDSSGSSIVLTTQEATLEDAIEEGNISLKQNLQKARINKVDYYYEGISYKLNKGQESNFDFDLDIILYDLDGNPNTVNDQVKLVGNFILDADVVFEAKISSFKLRNAKIGLEATNSESLELIANLNYTISKEITLATVHFSPIYFQLGPIPVVIVIKLDIKAGGSGYANASLSVGFENTVSFEAGISYVRGQGWDPYSEFDNQFNYNPPTLTANAGARVFVKPEISVGVYGVLAGYANAEAYGEILVDFFNNPWWQLYAGLDFGVGARARIFGIEIFDFDTNVLELRWLLAQASGNLLDPCPGLPNITDPRNGKVYNTVLIGNQCWLRENLDIGTRINGLQTQTNNGTIEKYCYDDNPANCNTYGGLYQWDEAMQYVTEQGIKGICPTGWHIPTMTEYMTLGGIVVGDANALKAVLQGTGNGAGTNSSGFTALLAGDRFDNGYFENLSHDAYFWSSSNYDETGAGNLNLYYDDDIIYLGLNDDKEYGFSVRCIKD
jgi:uncharacterized protein (TIGR02145 family)